MASRKIGKSDNSIEIQRIAKPENISVKLRRGNDRKKRCGGARNGEIKKGKCCKETAAIEGRGLDPEEKCVLPYGNAFVTKRL